MKKIDLGQTVAIAANIGVIGGIVFLALELQQTQQAMSSQAYQARAFDAIDWDLELLGNDRALRVATLIDSGQLEIDTLSAEEKFAAVLMLETYMVDSDNEHYQYQNGFLDEGFYENGTVEFIRRFAPTWRRAGLIEPRPGFRDEVDRILAVEAVPQGEE